MRDKPAPRASNVEQQRRNQASGTRGRRGGGDVRGDLAAYQPGVRNRQGSRRTVDNKGRQISGGQPFDRMGGERRPQETTSGRGDAFYTDVLQQRFGNVDRQQEDDALRAAGPQDSGGTGYRELDPGSPEYAKFKEESAAKAKKEGKTKAEWLNELYGFDFFRDDLLNNRGGAASWGGSGGGSRTGLDAADQAAALEQTNLIRGFI